MHKGYVVLVGAGPTRELLTLRGKQEIEKADVVVYDDLIDNAILDYAKAEAEKIYVGKRFGSHYKRQDEINNILLKKVREGKAVVRLKGGDSFVFGRGGEELLALQAEGVLTDVVPGISTCIAVPEDFGIPVTHRQVSKSFTVVTGYNVDNISESYEALAKLKGSIVFLMSLHTIPQICESLVQNGKDAATPCAVLSKGFRSDKQRVNGTLADISGKLEGVESPAIFMVGDTTQFDFKKVKATVNVVGSTEFCDKFKALAPNYMLDINAVPDLTTVPLLENVPAEFSDYSHIAFTSAKGVDLFFRHLLDCEVDFRAFRDISFACVGEQCANALKKYGFVADLVPSEFSGQALAQLLVSEGATNILVLRSARGSKEFIDILEQAGTQYTDTHIYTMGAIPVESILPADYTVFGSGDAVSNYFESQDLGSSKPVAIGNVTKKTLSKFTEKEILTARRQSVEDIIETILEDTEIETF